VPLGAVAEACGAHVVGDGSRTIRDVSYDSREAAPGALFACVPGAEHDGHDHAAEALGAGASALLVERPLDIDAPQLVVRSVREAMGPVSSLVFGRPGDAIACVAVTGTNGKTTITYLLESVFRVAGLTPGAIGTTGARIDGRPEPLKRTTPEAPDLQRLLAKMRASGVGAVAMEASSHALAQHRTDGLRSRVAVFTNLSQDHLDFHPTMEAYFDAKRRLFTPELAVTGVVCVDDDWGRRMAAGSEVPVTTYAVDASADRRISEMRSGLDGVSFLLDGVAVSSPLRGRFNVANCLGAVVAAEAIGIAPEVAAEGIARVGTVPGRMESVDEGQDFLVVVDYAHTPDSIRSVLRGARPLSAGKVICVFGCGGDRDRAKRSRMGEAAGSLADLTVVTSDNPRSEDPMAIIREVVTGVRQGGGEFVIEPDRRSAIGLAITRARPGDVIVIAGKGHETIQEIGGTALPFDDREVARELLRAYPGADA
jgi:UDP-N-acetylmuramoyl-L-alanyl-D-glutamate--2,6-diaminopimelate ligase